MDLPAIECFDVAELPQADLLEIARLQVATWPCKDVTAQMAAQRILDQSQMCPPCGPMRAIIARDGQGRLVAMARTFGREIALGARREVIMALGAVAVCPDLRGSGLGAAVVRRALAPVDQGRYRWSLFQTSQKVAPFYEKLGAGRIGNAIVNSLAPGTRAFWDEVAMRYPASMPWTPEPIDLLGPGY